MANLTKTLNTRYAKFTSSASVPVESAKVYFTPKQNGTGNASPTNIRPLVGTNGLTLDVSALNMFHFDASRIEPIMYGSTQVYIYRTGFRGSGFGIMASVITPGVYTSNSIGIGKLIDGVLSPYATFIQTSGNIKSRSITFADNEELVFYSTAQTDTFAANMQKYNIHVQVGLGLYVDEVYTGNTYPLDWSTEAGTTYGFDIDFATGVLTVTHKHVVYDGSSDESWGAQTVNAGTENEGINFYIKASDGAPNMTLEDTSMLCNMAVRHKSNTIFVAGECYVSPAQYFNIFLGPVINKSTATQFKAWLAENNLEITYKLLTPITYQLTPAQVKTLKRGTNTIWVEGADTFELTYPIVETTATFQAKKRIMAMSQPELRFWLCGDDVPVDNKWVDRVQGLQFSLLNGASHDAQNGWYDFSGVAMRGQLVGDTNSVNFNFGHHWIFVYDIYINRSQSKDTMCFFDVGSVTQADKAIGFFCGSQKNTASKSQFLNWKLLGNSSNPFTATLYPAFTSLPTNEFAHFVGRYEMFDYGDGYDRLKVTVNGIGAIISDPVPQVEYGPTWNTNRMVVGGSVYGSDTNYSVSAKIKDIKIYVID